MRVGVARGPRRRAVALSLLVAALFVPVGARAASWHGQGRASGTVVDIDGKPIAGATVTLRMDEEGGPEPIATDERGRWAALGLAAGRWKLLVEARGFIRGEGTFDVAESGPGPRVDVQLRPLDEVTPGGPENPQAVYAWLDKGNSLLAQERYAEARAEYEKALAVLPDPQKPEVLQAVARTWFLEGHSDHAVAAVKRGLVIAPEHSMLRQLLRLMLEPLGRGAEADAFLAALAKQPPTAPPTADADAGEAAAAAAQLPPDVAAALAAPAAEPQPGRGGAYKVRFAERSPWSAKDEMFRRAGHPPASVLKQVPDALAYDLARESFEVRVPDGEPPAAGWGLLVWISPGPFGGTLRAETHALLARHRLIWIGANASGNGRVRWDRWGLALDAVWHARKLYAIDPERVYVAGYSGGGRSASALTLLYPDVFRAGLMVMGIDWYRDLPVPDHPGTHWPAPFEKPPRDLLRLARERRFVLLTGERDFNRAQTRVVRDELASDGFRAVTYLEVPAISHYDPVPGEWLARAYAALDGAPAAAASPAPSATSGTGSER